MKKYLILMVALLFAFNLTAQTKQVTEKLQVTGVKNAELLKTDEKGNVVAGDFSAIQEQLVQLKTELQNKITELEEEKADKTEIQPLRNLLDEKVSIVTFNEYKNQVIELINNAGKVKKVNNIEPDENGNIELIIPEQVDISGKLDKGDYQGTASDLLEDAEIKAKELDDAIEIGGRNYLLNSKMFSHVSSSPGVTLVYHNNYTEVVATEGDAGGIALYTYFTDSQTDHLSGMLTISFDFRVIDGVVDYPSIYTREHGYMAVKPVNTPVQKGKWVRVFKIFSKSAAESIHLHLGFMDLSGTYQVKNFKLEEGTKPTAYTPAIEEQVADWTQTDATAYNFIKHKPDLSTKLDKGTFQGTATDLKTEIDTKLSVETDPVFSSWSKDYNDLINTPVNLSDFEDDLHITKPVLYDFTGDTPDTPYPSIIKWNRYKDMPLLQSTKNAIMLSFDYELKSDNYLRSEFYSTAIGGSYNRATNTYATAIGGKDNTASGSYSFVTGKNNISKNIYEFICGSFATVWETGQPSRAFVVGNGSDSGRSNALVVYRNGNIDITGVMNLKPTTLPETPKAGDVVFDSADNILKCYNGTEWKNLF